LSGLRNAWARSHRDSIQTSVSCSVREAPDTDSPFSREVLTYRPHTEAKTDPMSAPIPMLASHTPIMTALASSGWFVAIRPVSAGRIWIPTPTAAPINAPSTTVAGPSVERCLISQIFTPYSWSQAATPPPITTDKPNRSNYTSRKGTVQRPPANQATEGTMQNKAPASLAWRMYESPNRFMAFMPS